MTDLSTPRRILAALLCLAVVLSLAACRYSPTIEEIIYDQLRSEEIDFDAPFEPEENNPENEDTSDDLKDLEDDEDAERTTDETPEQPLPEDETEPDTAPAPDTEYLESAPDNGPTEGGSVSEHVSGDTPETDIGVDAEDQSGEGEGSSGAGENGFDYEGDPSADTVKQVVDAYGNTVELPADVDRVAATGELALMTIVLGGVERLSAVNSWLAANPLASSAFPGLGSVEALWRGDGVSPLSQDSFDRLVELAPDVVLEMSGASTVTSQQAEALAEAGIAYLVLPAPTDLNNVKTIMTTLGTVLGDRASEGGTNAPEIASAYVNWADGVYRTVSSATSSFAAVTDSEFGVTTSGTYTLYVDGWDADAAYRLYNETYTTLSGKGCAIIRNGATISCKTVSHFLSYANIVNTASQYGITPKTQYFTPLISAYRTMEVTGALASGMVTAGQKLLEQDSASLGTAGFPILLVADKDTAKAISESTLWDVYPHINSGDGSFNSDGFLDEEGNLVRTQISGEYEIVVNPRGLSSWTEGGCESILESAWAAWRFFGAVSEQSVRDYVSDFYSRFYGYTLSSSELDAILEGGFAS